MLYDTVAPHTFIIVQTKVLLISKVRLVFRYIWVLLMPYLLRNHQCLLAHSQFTLSVSQNATAGRINKASWQLHMCGAL